MKLLIASRNKDKIREIRGVLKEVDFEFITASDIPDLPDVIEDRDTIEGNAIKKAVECAKESGLLTLADDTGLFVDELNGVPGVYSSRYAGEECTYKNNRTKLLKAMKNIKNREAQFRTVVALASSEGLIGTATGEVKGIITTKEFGNNGFGYDPIFRSVETGKTFGEMTEIEKHKISHRGRAFRKIIPILQVTHPAAAGLLKKY